MFKGCFSYRLQIGHLKAFGQKKKDSELSTTLCQFTVHISTYIIGSISEPPNQTPHKASIAHTNAPRTSPEFWFSAASPAISGKLTISICQSRVLTGSHTWRIPAHQALHAPPLYLILVIPNRNKVHFLIYKNIPANSLMEGKQFDTFLFLKLMSLSPLGVEINYLSNISFITFFSKGEGKIMQEKNQLGYGSTEYTWS